MNDTDKPGRRRALVTVTAVLTTVATVAGLAVLASSTSPSLASTATPEAASTSANANPVALGPQAPASASTSTPAEPSTESVLPESTGLAGVRNVVFVLADDLDWELFTQVPRLAALQDEGMTFTNSTVTDSLCCPSRTSILRGQYIHNHRVVSNMSFSGGGWPTFQAPRRAHRLPPGLAAERRRHDRAVRQVPQRVPPEPALGALRAAGLDAVGGADLPR